MSKIRIKPTSALQVATSRQLIPSWLRVLAMGITAAAILVAFSASNRAEAATFCVNNGDALHNALLDAGQSAESDVIRITTGRMTTFFGGVGNPSWIYNYGEFGQGISVSGGWNSNCSQQTLDPTLSILDGRNAGAVIHFDNTFFGARQFSTQIAISNLTLDRGRATPSFRIAGLSIEIRDGLPGDTMLIENIIVTGSNSANNFSSTSPGVMNLNMIGGSSIRFRNSVIYGNNISAAVGGTTLRVFTGNSSVALISNNSIFDNVTDGAFGGGAVVFGVATLNNNVITENSSTNALGTMQFYSSGNGISLVNNHIPSIVFATGGPAINTGTTTGSAMWSGSGPFRLPNVGSPLRDSGTNNPAGGLLTTDIRGLTRIVNGVVDRGAVEAQPPANTGPIISALDPQSGSTTLLPATAETTRSTRVFFLTQSGTGTAQTTISCQATAGNGVVTMRPVQTVSNGGFALPVDFALDNPLPGAGNVQATMTCDVTRENAGSYPLTYLFVVTDPLLFRNGFE